VQKNRDVTLANYKTENHVAYVFTKTLPDNKFKFLRQKIRFMYCMWLYMSVSVWRANKFIIRSHSYLRRSVLVIENNISYLSVNFCSFNNYTCKHCWSIEWNIIFLALSSKYSNILYFLFFPILFFLPQFHHHNRWRSFDENFKPKGKHIIASNIVKEGTNRWLILFLCLLQLLIF